MSGNLSISQPVTRCARSARTGPTRTEPSGACSGRRDLSSTVMSPAQSAVVPESMNAATSGRSGLAVVLVPCPCLPNCSSTFLTLVNQAVEAVADDVWRCPRQ